MRFHGSVTAQKSVHIYMLLIYLKKKRERISRIWINMRRRIACVFDFLAYLVHQYCQYLPFDDCIDTNISIEIPWTLKQNKIHPKTIIGLSTKSEWNEFDTWKAIFACECMCEWALFKKRTLMMNDLIKKRYINVYPSNIKWKERKTNFISFCLFFSPIVAMCVCI